MAASDDVKCDKQVTRMADGRQIIYYWFNGAPARLEPDKRPPEPKKPAGEGR